jgi:predicted CoA-binding protein
MMTINNSNELRELLTQAKNIAVVGYSERPNRISHSIGKYLERAGYNIFPVNPTVEMIGDLKSYASLADVPGQIDIVNIFRRPEYVMGVVEDAIAIGAKAIWAQLGVVDEAAARKAEEAGIKVVMDRCIMVDHRSLIR